LAHPEHLARLLAGVPEWNAWRAAGKLIEVDLRGADLRGADLRGADLWYAKLQGADLSTARLEKVVLDRADLSLADLRHANLFRARLRGALLDHALLRSAVLVEADLTLAKVTEADIDGTIFTDAIVWGANFYGSSIESAHGLELVRGWIQEESQVPRRDGSVFAIERRDSVWHDAQRRASGA
jgi:uncharacterized protein YjbI with pentapeptide repeats